jgi:hypothetical protein
LIEFGAGAELTLGQYLFNKHMIFPKRGVELSDPANFASIGMTVTGMPRWPPSPACSRHLRD